MEAGTERCQGKINMGAKHWKNTNVVQQPHIKTRSLFLFDTFSFFFLPEKFLSDTYHINLIQIMIFQVPSCNPTENQGGKKQKQICKSCI
ncbi:hypothetical protein TorRG33x02_137300 [Trema orientale]|uniref:Uncharacterized protein n=1 Tax=Trema orientale TaxID=63057 RepID=A0A2P5EY23_TREOI|nr:hypothetical protein TorRG33x02_137300 [Trema orientale]